MFHTVGLGPGVDHLTGSAFFAVVLLAVKIFSRSFVCSMELALGGERLGPGPKSLIGPKFRTNFTDTGTRFLNTGLQAKGRATFLTLTKAKYFFIFFY